MRKCKVFIASPYTLGNKEENVRYAISVARDLRKLGFMTFEPLLYHYVNKQYPESYEHWMGVDSDWLKECDCVLRLPGQSAGADREILTAQRLSIPTFTTIDDLITWKETGKYNASTSIRHSL